MSDQERIQGTWRLASGERQGQALPDEVVRGVSLVFAGDMLATKTKDRATEARFRLIPETQPKGIDLDMGGAVGQGIYLLDGDDLKLAHGSVGDPRPSGFDAKDGPPSTILVLERVGR
jgi:uncharacterized protein (TIGR03067 family)